MLINLVSDVFSILHGQFAHTLEMQWQLTRDFSICRSRSIIADHGAVQTSVSVQLSQHRLPICPFLPAYPQGVCSWEVVVRRLPEAIFTLDCCCILGNFTSG